MTARKNTFQIVMSGLFIFLALICVIPVVLVIITSLTEQSAIANNGYSFFPQRWSFEAYRYIWSSARHTIFRAYVVTIFTTVLGTVIGVLIVALYAYPLSRNDFKYRNLFAFFSFFTMLFSGGMVSWYMICANVLKLSNTIWALIVPSVMNSWYVVILRTFFSTSIPSALIESAKIDGAKEYTILFKVVLPLSLPGIATIALFFTLSFWNDWYNSLMFITDEKLRNLQFLLQSMLSKIQMLNEADGNVYMTESLANVPTDNVRMALCMVAAGPILVVYPFFQKYFIRGLTVGAVKG